MSHQCDESNLAVKQQSVMSRMDNFSDFLYGYFGASEIDLPLIELIFLFPVPTFP